MELAKKEYWFKRRAYGYGWTPCAWQGWTVIAAFLFLVLAGLIMLRDAPRNEFSAPLAWYLMYVLILIVLLYLISLAKGPTPKWSWGKRSNNQSR